MARPQKCGLDYFPLDTVLDIKFELIEAEFGLTGFAVVVKLLQKIYAEQGYYCEYTNEVALLFAKRVGLGGCVVSEIVTASIKRGIFNEKLFDEYHILTSLGIQKRYFEAVSRRNVDVESSYLLVNVAHLSSNVHINSQFVSNNSEIVNNNPTNKSILNKSKSNQRKAVSGTDVQAIFDLFNAVCTRLKPISELMNYSREKATLNLLNDFDKNTIQSVFEKANASDFLCGVNDRKWKADFDWIIKKDKFVVISEGKYDNADGGGTTSYDIDEINKYWDEVPKL